MKDAPEHPISPEGDILPYAPKNFAWPRCPESDIVIRAHVADFLDRHCFAQNLARRMHAETSTRFIDWVDHIVLPPSHTPVPVLDALGFVPDTNAEVPDGKNPYWHPHADFPRILIDANAPHSSVAIQVESLDDFCRVFGDRTQDIDGDPKSAYRTLSMNEGTNRFTIVERHGYRGFVPQHEKDPAIFEKCKEAWNDRRSRVSRDPADDAKNMQETLRLAGLIALQVGQPRAADLILDCEREYWMSRNAVGRWQKARLDALGLGWGGIRDHHTFREDREHFPTLVKIFLALGFKKREPYSPPGEQYWAAQIMEHPITGDVLFLDVDFFPEDKGIDFSNVSLPPRGKFWTVGRWCALHDSSIRGAGMHHLECRFDFEKLQSDLESDGHVMMEKFSDFTYLKQAFTQGESWPVDPRRLEQAHAIGAINEVTYQEIKTSGKSIGSHLENLERNFGAKEFNQKGVGNILHDTDPERTATRQSIATTLLNS